ncbi:MAG: M20/M25/M40 family metallo-hydrolase [Clostridiales bacterium]|nr:M20/M25/M40 family metallo-hydrolase [Clostridiales bacterium]
MRMLWWFLPLVALLGFALMLIYRTYRFNPPQGYRRRSARGIHIPPMPIAHKLSELVKIPTVSHSDVSKMDEAVFIQFQQKLQTLFPRFSSRCERVIVARFGIVYRWVGRNSDAPSVLMSHYDVVAAPPDHWVHPPFSGEITEGYVWGRGTLDTKCTLAASLEAAESLMGQNYVPHQDIYFCFSGDEEVAGPTAPAILSALSKWGVTPRFVLDEGGGIVQDALPGVRQPAALIGTCEKGQMELIFTANGVPGHASKPPRHTALGCLAKAISHTERRPWPLHYSPTVRQMLDILGRHASLPWRIVYANLVPLKPFISLISGFKGGEFNAQLRTTCAFTMASASDATNVLPRMAQARANVRMLPGQNSKSVKRRAQRLMRGRQIEVDTHIFSEPSPVSRTDDEVWTMLTQAVEEVWPEALAVPYMFMAATDSRHYSRISEHVYRFSALAWSKEERALMHSYNERISLKALVKMQAFYEALIRKL